MENTKHVSQNQKVDMPELLSRVDHDRELLHDLLMIFKEDFPRHLEELRGAVAGRDMKAAKVVSHTLKGMLANLAVTKAAASAANLEQVSGGTEPEKMTAALAEFEREVDGLLPEMESHLEEVQP